MQVDRMLRERGGLAEPVAGMPARTRTRADTCFGHSPGGVPEELPKQVFAQSPRVLPLRGLHEPVLPLTRAATDVSSITRTSDGMCFAAIALSGGEAWGEMGPLRYHLRRPLLKRRRAE